MAVSPTAGTSASRQAQPQPPDGFTALFNGRDLSGWYGLEHFDPRRLRAMSDEERAAKRRGNDEPFRAHWRVENGELVIVDEDLFMQAQEFFAKAEEIEKMHMS